MMSTIQRVHMVESGGWQKRTTAEIKKTKTNEVFMKNEDALNNVRRKIGEVLNKQDNRLVFGWRGDTEPARSEGERWTDREGKEWEFKNGIRMKVTKLDSAKTPYWCPNCSKPLNHRFDVKFWRIRNMCMDCVAKEETKIRKEGKWNEYQQKLMLRNYVAAVGDKINELQNFHDSFSSPEYLLMDEQEKKVLMTERWNIDEEQVKADILKDIELLKTNLTEAIQKFGTGDDNEQNVTEGVVTTTE